MCHNAAQICTDVLPENRAVPLPRLCSILSTSFSSYNHAGFVTPFPRAIEMLYLHHLCPLLSRPSVYILVIVSLRHMLSDVCSHTYR